MELELPLNSPLAQAIIDNPHHDSWLVYKTPAKDPYSSYETSFRASIKKYSVGVDSILYVEFETWEETMERKARLAGL